MNADALAGIGELLAQYYLDLYHDSELVSLFIDRLTFESVCEEYCRASGLAMHDCCRYLRASPGNASTVYRALAIAAFQVVACNDVGYMNYAGVYDKLREKIPRLRHLNDTALMQDYFEGGQEEIWEAVNRFFKSKGKEICDFPAMKAGSGRYVQYPLSQQLRTTSEIIRYADKFLASLDPHAPYTFEEFKKRVSFFPGDSNDLVKHLIFSFYQAWDGQSTADYKRKRAAGARAQAAHSGQTVIEVDEASRAFSVLEYLSNSNAPKQISGSALLNRDGFRLFEYTDYQDWELLGPSGIPQEMACLGILADSRFLRLYKSAMPKAHAVYSEKNGEVAFIVFDSEEACESVIKKLGLKKEELSVWLSGGIKVGYNTYADEAMPVLHFREAQSEIYLNSEKIRLGQPLLQVSFKELKARAKREASDGAYSIKLPYCAPLRIRIARFSNNASAEPPAGFSASKSSIDVYDNKSGCGPLLRGLVSFAAPPAPPREDELCEGRALPAGAGRGLVLHKQSFERKFAFLRTRRYAR